MKALRTGFSFSILARQSFVNSTGDSFRVRSWPAISRIVVGTWLPKRDLFTPCVLALAESYNLTVVLGGSQESLWDK